MTYVIVRPVALPETWAPFVRVDAAWRAGAAAAVESALAASGA